MHDMCIIYSIYSCINKEICVCIYIILEKEAIIKDGE